MEKSDQKYLERYFGIILGLAGGVAVYCFDIDLFKNDMGLVNAITNIAGIIFGFLFASLAMIVQGTSVKLVDLMTNRKALFNRIIKYNKLVVLISLATTITSLLLLVFEDLLESNEYINALYSTLIIMMFSYTITFLQIFYSAIIDKKKTSI